MEQQTATWVLFFKMIDDEYKNVWENISKCIVNDVLEILV
jgi:hypothetical protein